MRGMLYRGWEGATIYIPVLLMALLALGTWWLVRNAPTPPVPAAIKEVQQGPDYSMTQFSIQNFDLSGNLQTKVQGALVRHYPATDTLEIDQMEMRSSAPNGVLTQATSDRALSNADASEIQLFGNAMVIRHAARAAPLLPSLEFRGEFLQVWPQAERVSSHQPVSLVRGKDRFTADSLEYNHLEQVLELRGRVRGILVPKSARSK